MAKHLEKGNQEQERPAKERLEKVRLEKKDRLAKERLAPLRLLNNLCFYAAFFALLSRQWERCNRLLGWLLLPALVTAALLGGGGWQVPWHSNELLTSSVQMGLQRNGLARYPGRVR